jgi:hypothetical protein
MELEHVQMICVEECRVTGDVDLPPNQESDLITHPQIALHPEDYH